MYLVAHDPQTPIVPVLGVVQETMLITLWARGQESRRPDAIIRDELAGKLIESIDYDFSRFNGGWKSQVGVAVRDRLFDEVVRDFLSRHPKGTVINLGAGLDLRFFRIDNGLVHWFDVDLPDAIALRRRLIKETDRLHFLEGSATDDAWFRQLDHSKPTLLIAEGVLMFFERAQVKTLLSSFSKAFPQGEMLFDLIGPLMVRFPFLHDTLPRTSARFRWGANHPEEIKDWNDRFEIRLHRSMLEECPQRWRWMRFCRHVPYLRRQFFALHILCRA